jgi:hypothetical protein
MNWGQMNWGQSKINSNLVLQPSCQVKSEILELILLVTLATYHLPSSCVGLTKGNPANNHKLVLT